MHNKKEKKGFLFHHHKEHFCRAVLEGIIFSIRDSLHIFDEHEISVNDLRMIGGGTNSPLWRQILCDVLGKNAFKPITGDASFGSALLAGVGIGAFKNVNEAASKCVHVDEVTKYSSKRHREYQRFYEIYQEIHNNLEDTAKQLHKIMQTES